MKLADSQPVATSMIKQSSSTLNPDANDLLPVVYEHSKMLFLGCLVFVFPFCLSFYQPCKNNADISIHILETSLRIIELNRRPVNQLLIKPSRLTNDLTDLTNLSMKHYPPGGVQPYMGYIGMCSPKGYGFSAALVINRVSILADFGYFGHK